MKKTLIAMAVAGVISVPAQAEVYGSIKEIIKLTNSTNTGADDAKDQKMSPIASEYVLGAKGTKDLGNGLTVGYDIAITNGADGTFKKDSTSLDFSSKFGKVYVGSINSATKIAAHYMNNSTSSWDSAIKPIENTGQDGLRYQSPNMSGFVADLVLGSNDDDTDSDNNRSDSALSLVGFAFSYANAGFNFTYGSQTQDSKEVNNTEDKRTAMTLGYEMAGFSGTYSSATLTEKTSADEEDKTNANGITLSYAMDVNQTFIVGSHSAIKEKPSGNKYGYKYTSIKYVYTFAKGTVFFFENMTTTGAEETPDTASLTLMGVKHSF